MFENVHGTVQPRDVKDPNGGYFRNPNYYYAIMVPTTVRPSAKGGRIR